MEGGSCNHFDYVCGDPVNGFDLSGMTSGPDADLQARCVDLVDYDEAFVMSSTCKVYREAIFNQSVGQPADFGASVPFSETPVSPSLNSKIDASLQGCFYFCASIGAQGGARYGGVGCCGVGLSANLYLSNQTQRARQCVSAGASGNGLGGQVGVGGNGLRTADRAGGFSIGPGFTLGQRVP